MKALSLWQPWATLVAIGAKQVETRQGTFRFKHRGELAIHAARHWSAELENLCWTEPFRSALEPLLAPLPPSRRSFAQALPFGAIIARTQLNNVFRTEKVRAITEESELPFGDFSDGRKALDLGPTVALAEPIRYRGLQGLFTLDDDTAAQVRELAPWPWESARVRSHA